MPRVDRTIDALLFDLNTPTSQPKASTLDYAFKQAAGEDYLWAVEVKYEGGPLGARISLRRGGGRHINSMVYPKDGWVKLWQKVPGPKKARQTWVRLHVHANAGRVWVRRMLLAPCNTVRLKSDRLALATQGGNGGA